MFPSLSASVSAALRLAFYLAWTIACLPPYLVALALRRGYRTISRFYWAVTARLVLRARIVVRGQMARERPLLCVANHVSYLDIVVLASLFPGSFVSKAEVRRWPGIGFLAILARTVFVDRRPAAVAQHRDQIGARLAAGEPLLLFPEGTSSDGNRVLPFRTSLFNVAETPVNGRPVLVQPLAITYTRHWGLPMGYGGRPFYAWYGDMDLATHLWEVLRLGQFTVEVDFLPPLDPAAYAGRKALARSAETAVRAAMTAALAGRPGQPETDAGAPSPALPSPTPPTDTPPQAQAQAVIPPG